MKSYSKIFFIVLIFIIAKTAFPQEIRKMDKDRSINTNYIINYKNESEYPKLYLGFKNQVYNGPYFGKNDSSAILNFNFDKNYLYIKVRKKDNERLDVNDNFKGDYNYLYFPVNENDRYYIKWGIKNNTIYSKGNLKADIKKSKKEDEIIFNIKIPWNKIKYFQNIPLKFNYKIYDYDKNNRKKMILNENYVNLYFNQPQSDYLHIYNPLYFRPSGKYIEINFELFLKSPPRSNNINIKVNNVSRSKYYNLKEGVNNLSLLIKKEKLFQTNNLQIKFENLKDKMQFYSFSDEKRILNNIGVLRKNIAKKIEQNKFTLHSSIDNKKYSLYTINKKLNVQKINILFVSSTIDLVEFYKHNKIDTPNIFIYKLPSKITYVAYLDFIKFIKDKINKNYKVNIIFWNIKKYRMFPYFLRYPIENRFKLYFISKYDIYTQKDLKLQRNLQNYEITFLYNKFNRKYLYSTNFINYKHILYLDQINLLNKLEYEKVNTFFDFISDNVKYNEVDGVQIRQLQNYNARYFTCSVERENEKVYFYVNNIKLFSYPVEKKDKIYINDKKYNVIPDKLNYFYYNPESHLWNVFTKQSLVNPSIKDFFDGEISTLKRDSKTKEVWEQLTGRKLKNENTDRIMYFGKKLPSKLTNLFDIETNEKGFFTETERFIEYNKKFIVVYRQKNRYLLWFNYKSDKYFEYPFNYILMNSKGEFLQGGGVIKR